jgi:hypothetical protein
MWICYCQPALPYLVLNEPFQLGDLLQIFIAARTVVEAPLQIGVLLHDQRVPPVRGLSTFLLNT